MRARVLSITLVVGLALVGLAGPAAAKGPSSATVEVPATGEVIRMAPDVEGGRFAPAQRWRLIRTIHESGYGWATGPSRQIDGPPGDVGPAVIWTWEEPGRMVPSPEVAMGGLRDPVRSPALSSFEIDGPTLILHPWAQGGPLMYAGGEEPGFWGSPPEQGWYRLPRWVVGALAEEGIHRPPEVGSAGRESEPVLVASTDAPGGGVPLVPIAVGAGVSALAGAAIVGGRARRTRRQASVASA